MDDFISERQHPFEIQALPPYYKWLPDNIPSPYFVSVTHFANDTRDLPWTPPEPGAINHVSDQAWAIPVWQLLTPCVYTKRACAVTGVTPAPTTNSPYLSQHGLAPLPPAAYCILRLHTFANRAVTTDKFLISTLI